MNGSPPPPAGSGLSPAGSGPSPAGSGVVTVDDPGDPRVADYLHLSDTVLRLRRDLFVAEGAPVIERAIRAGHRLHSLLLDPRMTDRLAPLAPPGVPVYAAGRPVLHALTGFHVHRGALATFVRPPLSPPDEVLAAATRVLVLEDVNNPTNLGAILRSAAGLGMDGLLLNPGSADPLYRRSVRVSMGEALALPYARLEPWPDQLALVRAHGFELLALTPDPAAEPLDAIDPARLDRAALLLGAEGSGLSAEVFDGADRRVRIPMAGTVDSLNVAAAAAVACWVLGRRPAP